MGNRFAIAVLLVAALVLAGCAGEGNRTLGGDTNGAVQAKTVERDSNFPLRGLKLAPFKIVMSEAKGCEEDAEAVAADLRGRLIERGALSAVEGGPGATVLQLKFSCTRHASDFRSAQIVVSSVEPCSFSAVVREEGYEYGSQLVRPLGPLFQMATHLEKQYDPQSKTFCR